MVLDDSVEGHSTTDWLELCEGARRHPRVLIRQTHMTASTSLLTTTPQARQACATTDNTTGE